MVANTTNFEPRIGVAWSTPNGNTVIRAGFGIYYDEIPVSLIAQLTFNRPTQPTFENPQTLYGQNFGSAYCFFAQCALGNSSLLSSNPPNAFYQAASVPFALSAVDPSHFNNPVTRQVSFSVERQITRNTSAEVAYIGNFMGNLPTTSNTGFNNEWFCTASAQGNSGQPCDAFSYVPVFTLANNGYGNYNAFVAKVSTRGWHGVQASRLVHLFEGARQRIERRGPADSRTADDAGSCLGLLRQRQPFAVRAWAFARDRHSPDGNFQPGSHLGESFSAHRSSDGRR